MVQTSPISFEVASPAKPRLRGVLHHWAAVFSFGAGVVLVGMSPSWKTAAAGALYALSLVALFGISATYHRVNWSERARARMRRMDHASIFILIAGTYTPVALLGLPASASGPLMVLVWGGAFAGVLLSVFWVNAPKALNAALCVALGWTIVPYFGEVRASLSFAQLILILLGGIAYTFGALAYAVKRPNPSPGVFGYHEVFHALTLVAAVCHFAAVVLIVRGAA